MARVDWNKQVAVAKALAEGVSVSEACRRASVSRAVVLRLQADITFQELVKEKRKKLLEVATAR